MRHGARVIGGLVALIFIASACAGGSPSAEAPELTVPDSMVASDADLQR